MGYQRIDIPKDGQAITLDNKGNLSVGDYPIVLFLEGDGIGVDITPVMQKVVDYAVNKAYSGQRKIAWAEVYAGEKANQVYGQSIWLPEETLDAIKRYLVAIKGPLTTPVGGGIRSLNVALRQQLDLFICQRPIRYYAGTPSPLREPEKTDMVIFRDNSEGIYSGIEWAFDTSEVKKLIRFLKEELSVDQLRFPETTAIGIKPVSKQGTERLVESAISYAIKHDRDVVTLVHKGNIMKHTEGAFCDWGYHLAKEKFGAVPLDQGPWLTLKNPNTGKSILINDVIADAFFQKILLRPEGCDVIATLNLNGDYLSDALAAQVGGIGIAPGANLNERIALFEATHGTAPTHAGKNEANPGSLILSAEMMLRHLGWKEAADLVIQGISRAILNKKVTYDFARLMQDAQLMTCSGFGDAIIEGM